MINFGMITACGECCDGCEKKEYARAVSKQMAMSRNGRSPEDVRFTPVQENTGYDSAVCAKSFRVNSCRRSFRGTLILLRI